MPSKPSLKIQRLPDTKPSKLTISIPPDLHSDLKAYARIYEQTYDDKQDISALIPSMLAGFLASDAGFKKARKELV